MSTSAAPPIPLTTEEKLRRAQEAFYEYRTEDMVVTEENLYLIVEELRLHGGHAGWRLANELSTESNRGSSLGCGEPVPDPALLFFPRVPDGAG